jgi:hypothetical protein
MRHHAPLRAFRFLLSRWQCGRWSCASGVQGRRAGGQGKARHSSAPVPAGSRRQRASVGLTAACGPGPRAKPPMAAYGNGKAAWLAQRASARLGKLPFNFALLHLFPNFEHSFAHSSKTVRYGTGAHACESRRFDFVKKNARQVRRIERDSTCAA